MSGFIRDQLCLDYRKKHWSHEGHLLHGSDQVLEITVWGRIFTDYDRFH